MSLSCVRFTPATPADNYKLTMDVFSSRGCWSDTGLLEPIGGSRMALNYHFCFVS